MSVFETAAHNLLPGFKETKLLDQMAVSEFEERFSHDFPLLWRPQIVERQFHDWLTHSEQPMPIAADSHEEHLLMSLFARVAVISYMLEAFAEIRGYLYKDLVGVYLLLGALRLRAYQEQGAFLSQWELPPVL